MTDQPISAFQVQRVIIANRLRHLAGQIDGGGRRSYARSPERLVAIIRELEDLCRQIRDLAVSIEGRIPPP